MYPKWCIAIHDTILVRPIRYSHRQCIIQQCLTGNYVSIHQNVSHCNTMKIRTINNVYIYIAFLAHKVAKPKTFLVNKDRALMRPSSEPDICFQSISANTPHQNVFSYYNDTNKTFSSHPKLYSTFITIYRI